MGGVTLVGLKEEIGEPLALCKRCGQHYSKEQGHVQCITDAEYVRMIAVCIDNTGQGGDVSARLRRIAKSLEAGHDN